MSIRLKAAGALAALALVAVPTTASAAETQQGAVAEGARFVVDTLAAGDDHYVYPGGDYFDGGNTIDAIIALDGAKAGRTGADSALAYLEAHVGDYIGSGGEVYAGPTAKTLLVVVAHGADPSAFGGVDLVAALTALQAPDGRLSDDSQWGDYSNNIGQALGVIALQRAGAPSTLAADFLAGEQCDDGGFPASIGADPCVSDPDATGFAIQAMVAAGRTAEATNAVDWLAARVTASGAVLNSEGVASTNSTGVAAQAFRAAGATQQLAATAGFIASLQYDCDFPAALRGGIASTPSAIATSVPADSDLRATPQALLGMAGASLVDVTVEGAAATAPLWSCSTATVQPTPTVTPKATTSVASPRPTAQTPELANTGAEQATPAAVLGLGALVLGVALVAVGRPVYQRRH